MSTLPHQRQIVSRLTNYWVDLAQFLEKTREEYYRQLVTHPVPLPTDSVASARIDGMPQAAVGMISEPTLRIVLTREAIVERIAAQDAQRRQELDDLLIRITQMYEWYSTLSTIQRRFVHWRWWEHSTQAQVAEYFDHERPLLEGGVPDTVRKVQRMEYEILGELEQLWYPVSLEDSAE